jgi:hypothetical protein
MLQRVLQPPLGSIASVESIGFDGLDGKIDQYCLTNIDKKLQLETNLDGLLVVLDERQWL